MNKFKSIISLFAATVLGASASYADGVYQIPNGNADMEWVADNEPGNGLHSFKNATLGGTNILLKTGKSQAQDLCYKETGRTGNAIAIKSKSVAGIAKANGNLTTGNVIMGSTTPADKKNHNETNRKMGADGSLEFVGLPDSLEFYAKYTRGEKGSYNGNVNAFIHGDIDFADPAPDGYPTKEDYVVAFLEFPITPCDDWTRFTGAFEYYTPAKVDMENDTRYMLMNMTTNPIPGSTANDKLIVDDIRFIYNSKIDSLAYDDVDLLNGNKDSFKLIVEGEYDSSKLFYRVDGRGATSVSAYDEAARLLTITVSGNDIAVDADNFHTYEIQFVDKQPQVAKPVLVSAMEFVQWLVVKAEEVLEPVKKVLTVELYDNQKANLKMDDATPAIKADSVAYTKDGDLTLIKGTAEDGTIVDLVAGADTAYGTITVGNTVMEYGKYVLPKIINTLSFEDYLIVDASAPEIKTLSVDLYDNYLATVKINSVVVENVAYESTENGIKLSGSGVELTISADNTKASGTVVDGEKTLEFGIYTPPTIVDSEYYSDTLYAIVNGVASEAEVKNISANFYSDGKVIMIIHDLTVGSFELGKVQLDGLKYETAGDSIEISGSAKVSTMLGSIPMTIKSAKTDAEYKGLKANIGVDLSMLGYVAEIKFGYPTEKKDDVVEPEVILIKDASYNDIMKYGKETSKETIVISYFSNGYATVVFPQIKKFIDSVAYERDADSIRFAATDIIVSGASSLDYSKLQMVFSDGRTFGYAPDTVSSKVYTDLMLTYSGKKYGVEKNKSISITYLSDNTATIEIADFNRIIGNDKKLMGDFVIEGVEWAKAGDSISLSGDVVAECANAGSVKNVPVKVNGSCSDSDFADVVLKMTLDMTNTLIGESVEATFGLPEPVELVKSVVYNDSLVVKSNGEVVTEGHEELKVDFYDNGYATISLFDFSIDEGLVVGDIIVDSVPYLVSDSVRMTAKRNITIAPKLGAIGASLGVLPVEISYAATDLNYSTMDAEINLDLVDLGEKINVIFGADKTVTPAPTVVMSAKFSDVLNANGELKQTVADVDFFSDKSVVVKVENMTMTGLLYTLGDSLRASGSAVLSMAGNDADVNVTTFVADRTLSKLYMDIIAGTNVIRFGYDTIPVVPQDSTAQVDTSIVNPGNNGPKLLRTVVYTDDLVINISGDDMAPQTQDITVAYYDNGYATLSIMNFIMGEGEDGMLVGDIILDSVPYTETDSIRMNILKNIFITSSNPDALGNSLPEIPVEIKSATSSNNFDKLKAVIGIDLEEMYVTVNFGFSDKTNTGVVEENVGPKLLRTVVYTDDLVINISGDDMQPQTQDITVAYYDNGMATLSIMNFVMGEGEDGMLVGDIVLENVPYTESDSIRMQILKNIFITSSNPDALGNSLPEIPVEIKSATSSINYDKLTAIIGIDLEDMYVTVNFGFSDKTNTGVVEEAGSENAGTIKHHVDDNYISSIDGAYYSVHSGTTNLVYTGDKLKLTLVDMTVDLGDGDIVIGDIEIEVPATTSDLIYFEGEDTVKIKTDDIYEIGNQSELARVKVYDGRSKLGLTKVFYDMEVELIDLGITFTVNFGDSATAVFDIPTVSNKVVDTRVFTISGVYVGDNVEINMLPAGIYIQNGKKFIVRSK